MTTRTSALLTIGLIAILLTTVAIASLVVGEISERAGTIITSVLGTFATLVAGLLLFLRLETVNTKVDLAAEKATVAVEKTETVETKLDNVHRDVLNGPMRRNVTQAIRESQDDPEIKAKRISTIAEGVKRDRHERGSREQAAYARGVLEYRESLIQRGILPPHLDDEGKT